MNDKREEFLRSLQAPVKGKSTELNDDLARFASKNKNWEEPINVQNQRQSQEKKYTAPKGTLNKAKKTGLKMAIAVLTTGILAGGTMYFLPKVIAEKEKQAELAQQAAITEKIEEVYKEYDQIEDITKILQRTKQYYDMGLNEEGKPITEENMGEELKNIQELLKQAYKSKIGKACGVKPEDIDKIKGVEERILGINDVHIRVTIPEEISPTGKRIDLMDDQVPEDIAYLIRAAGSINTNLNSKYDNPGREWNSAIAKLTGAINNSNGKYIFVMDGENVSVVVFDENKSKDDEFETR